MYMCLEIPHYAYNTKSELEQAIRGYPFKGGMARDFDLDKVLLLKTTREERVTLDHYCPLCQATWQNVLFNKIGSWFIGTYPNGKYSCITILST